MQVYCYYANAVLVKLPSREQELTTTIKTLCHNMDINLDHAHHNTHEESKQTRTKMFNKNIINSTPVTNSIELTML